MTFSLASIFTDHMVLQRGKEVAVWGKADPGSQVVVHFEDQKLQTLTDDQGRWAVTLKPMTESSQGQKLTATALASKADRTPETITLEDVLVGELWLCSGQSNMGMLVQNIRDSQKEIEQADHPQIRLFNVGHRVADEPLEDVTGQWKICSPQTIEQFSAAAYFFGREVQKKLGVPVGLVNSSWGGTRIEAWTSREALLNDAPEDPSVAAMVHDFDRQKDDLDEAYNAWKENIAAFEDKYGDKRNEGYSKGWAGDAEPASVTWKDMKLPLYWQGAGLNISGIFWFRKAVDLPEAWAGRELTLSIGAVDKSDQTYFNNTQVGSLTTADHPTSWDVNRQYPVDGKLVKAGENIIAVRVHSDRYAGGMCGPAERMHLTCPSLPDQRPILLEGTWRYAIEADYGKVELPEEPMGPDSPHAPARLHHAMLRPLVPMAMRGVIWYQGESNATRAVQYRTLSPLLIQDIRAHWADQGIAFHLVQLANYMARADQPPENSNWAMLREAQMMTLLTPGTGMAVAIDIGEANDIHPRNKQDVGLRLAHSALHHTYGFKDTPPTGPVFKQAQPEGKSLRVDFDHTWDGLHARGGKLTGFAIAGADKQFVWADARVQGDSVYVSNEKISEPKFVRYAWGDNPECNLYNGADLPACPFRTDKD